MHIENVTELMSIDRHNKCMEGRGDNASFKAVYSGEPFLKWIDTLTQLHTGIAGHEPERARSQAQPGNAYSEALPPQKM